MQIIKKLDIFILKNFLTLFAGTFCISLFVVMMQFLWKWVDELIGKGLTLDIIAKFFYYSGLTLVPLALPLAVLLASLISFGNLGERLELLAIKAAGIPLTRVLRPLVITNVLITMAAFHFQNKIAPQAQQDLMTLIYSMRTSTPEVDIPEAVFYDGIQGINLYVSKKDKDTGWLYDVIIYNMREGASRAHIILADSARLESSSNKMHLLLHLYSGEQFENLNNGAVVADNVPYRRETFSEKHFLIDFDTNFNMADSETFSSSANTKDVERLMVDRDSIAAKNDSLGRAYYDDLKRMALSLPQKDEAQDTKSKAKKQVAEVVSIDTIMAHLSASERQQVLLSAQQRTGMQVMDLEYKATMMYEWDKYLNRHSIEIWSKFTMSFACLLFFFIGAPLGAIIRKGGLGMPVVVAVLFFLFYYIVNSSGMNLAREGELPPWLGMWLSTLIILPMGVFFTVKANNDSVVFNKDTYTAIFRRLFGIRLKRHITRKEVIIDDPNYEFACHELHDIMIQCTNYLSQHTGRSHPLGYLWYILRRPSEADAISISERLETLVTMLSNSKDRNVLLLLNGLPIMTPTEFRFYRRRRADMKNVIKYCDLLLLRIEEMTGIQSIHSDAINKALEMAEAIDEDEGNA